MDADTGAATPVGANDGATGMPPDPNPALTKLAAGAGDLRESGPRPFEMREKFLVFIDGLIKLACALVQLAQMTKSLR